LSHLESLLHWTAAALIYMMQINTIYKLCDLICLLNTPPTNHFALRLISANFQIRLNIDTKFLAFSMFINYESILLYDVSFHLFVFTS